MRKFKFYKDIYQEIKLKYRKATKHAVKLSFSTMLFDDLLLNRLPAAANWAGCREVGQRRNEACHCYLGNKLTKTPWDSLNSSGVICNMNWLTRHVFPDAHTALFVSHVACLSHMSTGCQTADFTTMNVHVGNRITTWQVTTACLHLLLALSGWLIP